MAWSIRWLALVVLLGSQVGCSTFNKFSGPPIPYSSDLAKLQVATDEENVSNSYWAATNEADRKDVRNKYITQKLMLNDILFLAYVREISADRRNLDAATAATQMTLGIAATLVGGVRAKENLAALITLVTGGKAIVDRH